MKKNVKKTKKNIKSESINENKNTLFMKIFLIVFIAIFSFLVIGIVFNNQTVASDANTKNNLISLLIAFSIFPFIFLIINNKFKYNKKKLIIFYVISYLIFLSLQLLILYYTRNNPGWDWEIVYDSALNYVKGNLDKVNYSYFSNFPNNKYLFVIEVLFLKVIKKIGLLKYSLISLRFLNVFFVNLAGVLTVLTIRKVYGEKFGIYGVVLVMLSSAFYLQLPIVYTDTFAIPIPIAIIYLYLNIDKTKKENEKYNKKNILLIILMSFLIVLGMKIKFTCIIMFLGIVADLIFNKKIKENLKLISGILICMLSFLMIFRLTESRLAFFQNTKNGALPYTHWMMMGLFERPSYVEGKNFIGGYDADLYSYTFKLYTTKNMIKGNIKKAVEKLKEYGPFNYAYFLYRKALFTWGEGSYTGSILITEEPMLEDNIIHQILFEGRKYYIYYYLKDTALILFMYMSLIIGALKSLKNNLVENNKFYITIFGLLTFLLIWETNPRYLVHFVPIIIVGCIPGIQAIVDKINEVIKQKKKAFANK